MLNSTWNAGPVAARDAEVVVFAGQLLATSRIRRH
jgi:hypothetical protein